MLLYARGSETDNLTADDLKAGLYAALDKLGGRNKVLAIPPDITRFYSRAGELTEMAWQYYGDKMTDILPGSGYAFPHDRTGNQTHVRCDADKPVSQTRLA